MSIADLSVTYERSKVMDFLETPLNIDNPKFFYRLNSGYDMSWLMLISKPYRTSVWLLLAFGVVTTAAMLTVITKSAPASTSTTSRRRARRHTHHLVTLFGSSLWYCLGGLLGQGNSTMPMVVQQHQYNFNLGK